MQKEKRKVQNLYKPSEIEPKWQAIWLERRVYSPNLDTAKKPFYNLMMFPYPSAEGMHIGNMYAFTGADVFGRFMRMKGFDVFEPIGLDGFGIHSENYAIKTGRHPKEQAKISKKNFYRQLREIGNSFDWSRTVETYDPYYYKWTQWLFIQLFKAGLAYRKKAPVNFCSSCKTVLADEQVITKSKINSSASLRARNQKSKSEETVGVCERCLTPVEKRELEQWFFKITKYADRLLSGLTQIDWVEKVKIAQREWIGRSEGALIQFRVILNSFQDLGSSGDKMPKQVRHDTEMIEVFTTRPDTLYGATFLVLSPKHPLVSSIDKKEVKDYIRSVKGKIEQKRIAEDKEKSGVFTGLYAINPVNKEQIPIWIADYVLMEYGTGAIMAVPAHDQRDFEFAKKYDLPTREVIVNKHSLGANVKHLGGVIEAEAYVGEGKIINSGDWNGWQTPDSIGKVIDWLHKNKLGERKFHYHLRDWLISRQRYWGPPIPLVFCENCAVKIKNQKSKIKNGEYSKGEIENPGWISVREKDLPVELPFIEDYKPLGTGKAPLASHPEFYQTKCPKCEGGATRETDVSDTFLDSAWYFLRYLATDWNDMPFPSGLFARGPVGSSSHSTSSSGFAGLRALSGTPSAAATPSSLLVAKRSRWLPVDMYIGGAEHSVLHLLYARFMTMVLHDLGFIEFEEPFSRFYAHGLIIKEGAKMSKSKGNMVVPDEYIKKYGADTVRSCLMFTGPFNMGGDFRDTGIEGMYRFLQRVWRLAQKSISNFKSPISNEAERVMHKTIKRVTEDIGNLRYNTAIARLMEYYNFLSDRKEISKEEIETLLLLLAPFAPYMTEELYQRLCAENFKFKSIHLEAWPTYDPKFLEEEEVTVAVQVDGKIRDTLKMKNDPFGKTQGHPERSRMEEIEKLAKKSARVLKYIEGKEIKKVVYVEGKIINFVLAKQN